MTRGLLLSAMLLCPVASSAAPTPADIAAYRALSAQDLRLATIGHRLASANAPFCGDLDHKAGWVIHDIAQYPDKDVARAAFGFEQPVEIAGIVSGSDAEKAGVKAGDAIIAISGDAVADISINRKTTYDRVSQVKHMLSNMWRARSLPDLTVQSGDQTSQLHFTPAMVCASDFQVDTKDNVDAGADGKMVSVTVGMMNFAADDGELAAVVAHELAHNLLRHRARLAALKSEGKKNTRSIYETEVEADRLSAWLLANAGYDLEAALRFWERYGRKFDYGIFGDGTHPGWKKRIGSVRAEIAVMAQTGKVGGLLPPPLLATSTQ